MPEIVCDWKAWMAREWQPEQLIECWTLLDSDQRLVANKSGATRLGFALMLKFFELEARFPRSAAELPAVVVEYVAAQVKVPTSALDSYQQHVDLAATDRVSERAQHAQLVLDALHPAMLVDDRVTPLARHDTVDRHTLGDRVDVLAGGMIGVARQQLQRVHDRPVGVLLQRNSSARSSRGSILRARAAKLYPSDLRASPRAVRLVA